MRYNLLEYLDEAVDRNAQGVLYQNGEMTATVGETAEHVARMGSGVARRVQSNQPVVVFTEKNCLTPAVYLGVLGAGCHYIPLDSDMPPYRLARIIEVVQAGLVVTDDSVTESLLASLRESAGEFLQVSVSELLAEQADAGLLAERRRGALDTDAACVIFTSGSTGIPKGVVLSHRNIFSLIEGFAGCFALSDQEVYGNQAPLDYVEGIKDIFLPLRTGGRTVFTPKPLFAQPIALFDYLNAMEITSLCWASPALTLCSKVGIFAEKQLTTVNKIFFTGSVLPGKHLRVWQENLPGALFVNHYGPTEATASDTWYTADQLADPEAEIPVGKPFPGARILLLGEDGTPVYNGRGEIAIGGSFVASGYYRAPDLTAKVFVQNPAQDIFPEKIYRTGDIGSWDADGNLLFHGRMDNQIKHMGHRIELSEIENTVIRIAGIGTGICLYDKEKEFIWLFYAGEPDKKAVATELRRLLPAHMIPRKFIQLEEMPLAFNGKPDMNQLRALMGK